jgi:hypothetical protein
MPDFRENCLATQEYGIVQDHPIERIYACLHFPWTRRPGGDLSGSLTVPNHDPSAVSATLFVTVLRTTSGDPQCSSPRMPMSSCSRALQSPGQVVTLVPGWSSVVMVALERKSRDRLKGSAVTALFSFMDPPSGVNPTERLAILEHA